jgi:hypothetical protein
VEASRTATDRFQLTKIVIRDIARPSYPPLLLGNATHKKDEHIFWAQRLLSYPHKISFLYGIDVSGRLHGLSKTTG